MCRILGVNGSLRKESTTRRMMERTLKFAEEAGAETHLLDLAEIRLPLFNPDDEAGVDEERVSELVLWADAYILGTPDYHGSMGGAIVNFMNYFHHEFTGKLFGYVVSSHERGLTAMDQLRTSVRQCQGWSLPYGLGFNGDDAFDKAGEIADPRLAQRARMMAHDMKNYGGLLHDQFKADLAKSPREVGFAEKFQL